MASRGTSNQGRTAQRNPARTATDATASRRDALVSEVPPRGRRIAGDQTSARAPAQRGQDTRVRMIEAGLELFGAEGFQSVSTRTLARRANVNLAAMAYHFGGKLGLYEAVTRSVVAELRADFLPHIQQLRSGLDEAAGDRRRLAHVVAAFFRNLLGSILGPQRRRLHIAFVLREYTHPGPAFPILFEGVVEPLHRGVTQLVAELRGLPAEHPQAILCAHALIGQCFGFAIARAPLQRRMNWDRVSTENIDSIAAAVVPLVLSALELPNESKS